MENGARFCLSFSIFHFPFSILIVLLSLPAQGQLLPNLGGQRVGISALTFLKNDISPRSMAMGGANVTTQGDLYSAATNPALMSEVRTAGLSASTMRYGQGALLHSQVTAAYPLTVSGTLFAQYHMLNMGNEAIRTEFQPYGTGQTFSAYSLSAGLGYSQNLSDRFSAGVTLKFMQEKLAQYTANAFSADVGFLYRVDFRNLRFAAALQHFGTNSTLSGNYNADVLGTGTQTGTSGYPAPTLFKMGAQIDAFRQGEHLLTAHLQLNHPNDNSENIRIGAEYAYAQLFYARLGIKLGVDNEQIPSGGLGLKTNFGRNAIMLDYAVFQSRYLGLYQQLGIRFSLAPMETETVTPVSN